MRKNKLHAVPSGAGIFVIMFFMCGGMLFVHAAAAAITRGLKISG
jgi:hypothetical protein